MGGEFTESEKVPFETEEAIHDLKDDGESEVEDLTDTFVPFPPFKGIPEERMPLTFRAVLIGICLGSLVNASNVYLGLKTGFTFSASMFGAIFGFGITKALSKTKIPLLRGEFDRQENSIIQASVTSAGGLSGLFPSGDGVRMHLEFNTSPKVGFDTLVLKKEILEEEAKKAGFESLHYVRPGDEVKGKVQEKNEARKMSWHGYSREDFRTASIVSLR
ncbi:hypothetical protein B0A48_18785 [Cryoendolithus antarcticus]|uniref:Uncharacterized protein n=1 Tax=Cryoendolithus antarcticus TaxID=1507870 RepID=A0A1V8S8K8_9PEZI|nr:hypothetical protein B0A48_18785 [Cryoendolithus antarcticus]